MSRKVVGILNDKIINLLISILIGRKEIFFLLSGKTYENIRENFVLKRVLMK